MKKGAFLKGLAAYFCVLITVLFAGLAFGADYQTLVGHKNFSEVTSGYLASYNGMVEGKKAYGVELDWIWLDPGVNFQKYQGLAIIFEDWAAAGGQSFGEMLKRQFANEGNIRSLFKQNIAASPNIEAFKASPQKYAKPGYLIMKACITKSYMTSNPFTGPLATTVVEMALIDADDHRIVGKIIHKRHRQVSGAFRFGFGGRYDSSPPDDFANPFGELLRKYGAQSPNFGTKLEEFDKFKE